VQAGVKEGRWAAHFKGKLEDVLVPELRRIQERLPLVWQEMCKQGKIDIVIAMDNTSRRLFDGKSAKIESGVVKVNLLHVPSCQQSPFLAIPIFLQEGALRSPTLSCRWAAAQPVTTGVRSCCAP